MTQKKIVISIIIIVLIVTTALQQTFLRLDNTNGQLEFRAFWAAGYALRSGDNFNDSSRIFEIQQSLTEWTLPYPQPSWSPPWFVIAMIPLTAVSFQQASRIWMWANIGIILASTILIWFTMSTDRRLIVKLPLGLVATLLCSPFIKVILTGQASAIVLFGVACFLFTYKHKHWLSAGIALSLTTIKPQIVFLTAPILLLNFLYRRQWKILVGFTLPLVILTGLAFILRSTLLSEYFTSMGGTDRLSVGVPTLSYILSFITNIEILRYIGFVFLIGFIAWWWKNKPLSDTKVFHLTINTVILSLIVTPYAWTFDAILLVIPIQVGLIKILQKNYRFLVFSITGAYILGNMTAFYQESQRIQAFYLFWYPLFIAILYILILYTTGQNSVSVDQK